jgi:UDP-glucose 4-epimerase
MHGISGLSQMKRRSDQGVLRVGVTGASGDLGKLLIPILLEDPAVAQVVAYDVAAPDLVHDRLEFVRADLTRPGNESELTRQIGEAKLDALYHLAFVHGRVHSGALAHELEVIGSLHVLAAAGQLGIPRLIVPSLTALYGARPNAPLYLSEHDTLFGAEGSRFIQDKVEVERQLERFQRTQEKTRVLVLRFAPMVGPKSNNPVTRLLKNRFVPTLMGFDPPWQVLHEEDAAHALHLALTVPQSGVFNVVADGLMPWSMVVELSGGRVVPLPRPILMGVIGALEAAGVSAVPPTLLDFLRFPCVADGHRAARELGFIPRYTAREAAASLRSGGN